LPLPTHDSDLFENLGGTPPRVADYCRAAQLREEHYGYALRKALATRGWRSKRDAIPAAAAAGNPGAARERMAREDKRNKRFYRLSKDGARILKQLPRMERLNSSLKRMF